MGNNRGSKYQAKASQAGYQRDSARDDKGIGGVFLRIWIAFDHYWDYCGLSEYYPLIAKKTKEECEEWVKQHIMRSTEEIEYKDVELDV